MSGGATLAELPTGTVTFLFTDLESSTRLWEEQPVEMKAALARHDELLANAVEAQGGHVVKTTGDGVHAVFATAEAAIAAALAGQAALAAEDWEPVDALRVRMGLHTGVAEQRAGDYYGQVLNRAARVMGVAHPGQVLCTQATADLVRDSLPAPAGLTELGPHRLRGLERPEVVFQVTHPVLPADFPPLLGAGDVMGNLPREVTSFVGHDDDLISIGDELERTPVVTLTGVGGVGKTRLALEVAARIAPRFRDGAWLCELAGVREADVVCDAVLDAFGVEPQRGETADQTLVRFLRAKDLVLVLDNCEHLLKPAARLVDEIVRASPDVRVLATSREGLGVAGERIRVVTSLDAPEGSSELGVIAASEAVRLFVERAQAVRSTFSLDETNAEAVAQICTRLDGVPLAIELAAARISMLTPTDLARRLDRRFRVLTGSERGAVERHQTLRAAIDWSYDLLAEDDRCLLDRLSVFVGGFTLAAAEAITTGNGIDVDDVFDLLARLVARHLVVADTSGAEARYRLLETIRQYAQERLEIEDDRERVRRAHADYYTKLAEQTMAATLTADEQEWVRIASPEADNVRAALAWAIEAQDIDLALRPFAVESVWSGFDEIFRIARAAAPAIAHLPGVSDHTTYPTLLASAAMRAGWENDLDEMRRNLDEARAASERQGVELSPNVRGAIAWLAMAEGDLDRYRRIMEEMCATWRTRGDRARVALSLASSAMARYLEDDIAIATEESEEALALANEVALPRLMAMVQANAAFVLADVQPERAGELMREALRTDVTGIALESMLGDVAERLGDGRLALELFVTGGEKLYWAGYSEILGRMLRRIGLLVIDHDPETAARLIGAGTARSLAATLTERVTAQHEQGIATLEAALGAARCRQLLADGAAVEDRDALAIARSATDRALAADAVAGVDSQVSERATGNVFRRDSYPGLPPTPSTRR